MQEDDNLKKDEIEALEAEDRGDDVDLETLAESAELADEAHEEQFDIDSLREIAGEEERPKMVPHARFNEVNESLKAEREARLQLEEELARARGAAQPEPKPADEPSFDFDEADERYTQALYEGDTEKARQIRADIRAAEREEYERLAEERAEARVAERMAKQEQEQIQASLEKTAAELTEKYPFLDAQSPDVNHGAIDEVVALRNAYINRGTPAADALRQAADRVAKLYGVQDEQLGRQPARLTQEQINRNLGREQQIPPRDRGVGERAARIDYARLTEDEFDKLSDAEKAKARGDFIG